MGQDDDINEIARHITEDPDVFVDDEVEEITSSPAAPAKPTTKPETKPDTTPSKPDKESSPFRPTKPAVLPDRKAWRN